MCWSCRTCRDLAFVASGNSTLAIDADLGGPTSKADMVIVNGDISGQTVVKINNTSGPGVFAPQGLPVLFIEGDVSGDAFVLEQPLDTGFFDYGLHFVPTGSGVFELRSFVGAGAFVCHNW